MTTHDTPQSGKTQCQRILKLLEENKPSPVAMTLLHRESGSLNIHSRIADLRKRGHAIENIVERVNGKTHSYYKLL